MIHDTFDRPDFEKGIETILSICRLPPPRFDRPDFEKGIETIYIVGIYRDRLTAPSLKRGLRLFSSFNNSDSICLTAPTLKRGLRPKSFRLGGEFLRFDRPDFEKGIETQ